MRVELEWGERGESQAESLFLLRVDDRGREERLNRRTVNRVSGFFAAAERGAGACHLDAMCAAAERAFESQAIFVLLDDRQAYMAGVERSGGTRAIARSPLPRTQGPKCKGPMPAGEFCYTPGP